VSSASHPLPPAAGTVAAGSSLLLKAISVGCLVIGLACLVPAVYYTYLGLNPPAVGPGDLDFGGGTGLVLGGMFAVPAVTASAIGILLPTQWRRGRTTGITLVAALALAPTLVIAALVAGLGW
jgi:hypothetical protein